MNGSYLFWDARTFIKQIGPASQVDRAVASRIRSPEGGIGVERMQVGRTPVIVGIAGSLRKGSYNAALLRAAIELAPPGAAVEQASLHGIPLYDGDLEAESGIPPAVADLKERIAGSAGLLLVTPEYNSSLPGVLKNAIDWLSRPPADMARVFRDRPVAVMGTSPGRLGTALSQAAWLPVLRALELRPWWGSRMVVGGAGKVFDESGRLVDERVRSELGVFMAGFVEFAVGNRRDGELA